MKRNVNILLFIIFLIILFESLHYLELVKVKASMINLTKSEYLSYTNEQIIAYFLNVSTFVIIAIYLKFLKYVNIFISRLVILVLMLGNILYKVTIYKDNTYFYYITLLLQLILFFYFIFVRLKYEKRN